MNVANNHVYDYGPEALLDTIETLDRAGIPHVGAGANLKEASKPYYFVCNGRKIASALIITQRRPRRIHLES